jgi:hypothetical protein
MANIIDGSIEITTSLIWVVHSNGLINTCRSNPKVDYSNTKPGDKIFDFYQNEQTIYNIVDLDYSLTSEGVVKIDKSLQLPLILNLFQNLIKSMQNFEIKEISADIEEKNQSIIKSIIRNGFPITSNDNPFCLSRYVSVRNQLIYELYICECKQTDFMFNLIEAYDAIVFKGNYLLSYEGVVLAANYEKNVTNSDIIKAFNEFNKSIVDISQINTGVEIPSKKPKF